MIVGIFARIVSEKDGKIELDLGRFRVRIFDKHAVSIQDRDCDGIDGLAEVILDLDLGPFEIVNGSLHALTKH